jgi:hypothetical protein
VGFLALNRRRGGRARSGKKENKISRNPFSTKLRFEPLEDRRLLSIGVGNFVWNDLNSNGIQDTGEPGVAGAVVELFSSTDGTIGNSDDVSRGIAITDANGNYAFSGVPDGLNYYEVFRTPVGYTFTVKDATGSNDTNDSDADSTGVTAMFTVTAGQIDTTRDAGLVGAAPGFGFALRNGTISGSGSQSVATDAAGNLYVTGSFMGTDDLDPGPGTYNLTDAGGGDVLVAKFSSAGALVWARLMGGVNQDEGTAIAVAADGSVYTTGYYQGMADFNPGPATSYLIAVNGPDIFVSKLDSAGNFVWARSMGGSNSDSGKAIAIAGDGSVYTTGYYYNTVDFNPGAGIYNLTSSGGPDIFVSKLDSSGSFVWARSMGGTDSTDGSDTGTGIAASADGYVYTTGYFTGTGDFDPGAGTINLTSSGGTDIFLTKFDAAGNIVWARSMGGTSNDISNDIAVANDGSVYTAGYFQGVVDFDPGAATFYLTSAGGFDIFISKLDTAGNYVWARRIGGSNADSASGIAVTGDGNVYTTGYYTGTVDFDPGPGTFNLTSGGSNTFFSKLDSAGHFLWARRVSGTYSVLAKDIAVAGDGGVYTTGNFYGTVDFDPGTGTFNLTSLGVGINAFALKLNQFSVGDRVWNDLNSNGIQDAGEPGIAGAGVEIYSSTDSTIGNSDDVLVAQTITDANGHYSCSGFLTGVNYYEIFRAPVGFTFTTKDAGGNDALDSDAGSTGVTAIFTISAGQTETNLDAGMIGAAPGFGFALSAKGSPSLGYGESTATDAAGNVYVAGYFEGTVDFDPGPGTYNIAGTSNDQVFVAKYSSAGALIWARWLQGGPSYAYGITVGADGSVYTVGSFSGTVDFDPGPGTNNLTCTTAVFISKLDSKGSFVWARSFNGTSVAEGDSIAVASDGSVYTTGCFYFTVDFDPGIGTYNLTSAGLRDIFVSKLDASGNFVWAHSMGGGYQGDNLYDDVGYGIALASDGSAYIGGYYGGTCDFDPGGGVFNLPGIGGSRNNFLTKLDAAGNFMWACRMGGTSLVHNCIAVADNDSVYMTGGFQGTDDFDPSGNVFNLTSAGSYDVFISKLDATGNFVWACCMGGVGEDQSRGIAVANDGSVYTTGSFAGTADFDPSANTFNLTGGGRFASMLDAAGNFCWVRKVGGSSNDIAVAQNGSVYITGSYYGTTDFDPGPGIFNLTNSTGYDNTFVLKLLPDHAPTNIELSGNSVAENQQSGTVVGSFSSVDPDAGEAFTYSLVSGSGGNDNAAFTINASGQLQTAAVFDYETKSSYGILVRTTDYSGMWFEEAFTISVINLPETRTWDGGSTENNFWKTKENWVGDIAPLSGDILIFPSGAARMLNFNDYPSGTVFGSITVSGSGYHFQGNPYQSSMVEVQANTNVEVNAIHSDSLTLGAGAVLTISPIVATRTWDGGSKANNLWKTKENWIGDVAPIAGDNLIFPAIASQKVNFNDYSSGTVFGSITVSGSGYHFQGNAYQSSMVEVQSNINIEVNAVHSDTLTLDAGATLTIAAIPGGPLAADSALTPLATSALRPNLRKPIAQPTAANTIAPFSSTTTITIAAEPLADSTVLATPAPVSSEAASMGASSSSLSSDSNALTPGPSPEGRGEFLLEPLYTVIDAVAAPTEITAEIALPVRLVESAPARLIDTALNRLPLQSPIYSWIDPTALPKGIDNWFENPLAGKQTSNAKATVFASLHDELPLRAGIIEKRAYAPATNNRRVDLAALQTIGEKTGDEVEFDIAQHIRSGKHSKQLEKAVDEVLAEEEDAIPVEL